MISTGGAAAWMRRILSTILLIAAAWAMVPDAASAHEAGPHASVCADCVTVSAEEHRMLRDCHDGGTCVVFSLFAVAADTVEPSWPNGSAKRLDEVATPRSAVVAQDLPPPRA